MKNIITVFFMFLVACQSMPSPKTPQDYINQGNIALTAVYQQVDEDVKNGLMTAEDAKKIIDQANSFAKRIDAAQELFDKGLMTDAQTQAQIIDDLIIQLQKELLARSKAQ